jgi:hypothetical protein
MRYSPPIPPHRVIGSPGRGIHRVYGDRAGRKAALTHTI